jgi:hypothetical protein
MAETVLPEVAQASVQEAGVATEMIGVFVSEGEGKSTQMSMPEASLWNQKGT